MNIPEAHVYTMLELQELNRQIVVLYFELKKITGRIFTVTIMAPDGNAPTEGMLRGLWKLNVDDKFDIAVTPDHGLEAYYQPTNWTDSHLDYQRCIMLVLMYFNRDYLPCNDPWRE